MAAQFKKLEEQAAANKAELERMKAADAATARNDVLTQLGVKPQYREFAPANVDARTPEGRAALEKWATERPEIRTAALGNGAPPVTSKLLAPVADNPLAKSPFYKPEHIIKNAQENGIKL